MTSNRPTVAVVAPGKGDATCPAGIPVSALAADVRAVKRLASELLPRMTPTIQATLRSVQHGIELHGGAEVHPSINDPVFKRCVRVGLVEESDIGGGWRRFGLSLAGRIALSLPVTS